MKIRLYTTLALTLLGFALYSCKTLDMTVSVSTRPAPDAFFPNASIRALSATASGDTATFGRLHWRHLFQDTLLTALIDTALKNNFDLKTALQRIEFAKANLQYARGEILPKVQGSIGGGVRKYGLYTMDGAGNITTEITPGKIVPINLPDFNFGIQTTWEADIWGKLRNKSNAAEAQVLASAEGVRFLTTAIITEVATAYYDLVALDNELDIFRNTIQKYREALQTIEFQKEAGRANELAVQQFEAQVLSLQAQAQETEQLIRLRENDLNALLGRFPEPIARRKEMVLRAIPEQFATGVPAQMLENRPDIREAEQYVRASAFEVEAAKAAFFPTLTLSADIGLQAFDPQFLLLAPASLAYSALGGLVAPLVNWQGLEAQFSSAKSTQIQALYQYHKSILNGYVEVVNSLSTLQTLQQILLLKNQERAVLLESVDIAGALYKSAKATYIEVLLTQANAFQAQMQLIGIQKQQRVELVQLYRALGGGWR